MWIYHPLSTFFPSPLQRIMWYVYIKISIRERNHVCVCVRERIVWLVSKKLKGPLWEASKTDGKKHKGGRKVCVVQDRLETP